MGVDYEQLLKDNEAAKQGEIKQVNDAYGKTASDYQAEVDKQTQQLKDYEAEQTRLQQAQTDFAIDKINQQQEQAEKDYTKEQQAAYGDYKKQTDLYGVNAEQMAAMGLSQSGYSESSNVAMYTAYQNRVAAARASIEQAKLSFANAIQEAKLTNDINLAKIAQETLEKSLALSMESVIYLGNLEREKAAKLSGIEQTYYDRAQDIRDAQAAEIEKAQKEGMFSITDDEGIDDVTLEEMLKTAYPDGVVDDVDYWNQMVEAAGGEEALKALGYQLAGQGDAPTSDQSTAAGQTDERANAYFALQKEYEKARSDLALLEGKAVANPRSGAGYNSRDPGGNRSNNASNIALEAQREYVDKLKEQLAQMPKPTENSVYISRENECKKAKEALEATKSKLASMRGSGVSAGVLSAAEEEVKNAQQAYDKAYEALMSTDRYIFNSTTAGTTTTGKLSNNRNQVSMR